MLDAEALRFRVEHRCPSGSVPFRYQFSPQFSPLHSRTVRGDPELIQKDLDRFVGSLVHNVDIVVDPVAVEGVDRPPLAICKAHALCERRERHFSKDSLMVRREDITTT